MPQLFGRALKLQVDTELIETQPDKKGEQLQVRFTIHKTLKKQPNSCEIAIANLSAATRAKMKNKGAFVELSGGYGTTTPLLFRGNARYINHTRKGAEWLTTVECGDGEIAYRFSRINQSFKPGTPMRDLLKSLVSSFQGQPGNALEKISQIGAISDGHSLSGSTTKLLDDLLKPYGMNFSIQNGALQVNEIDKPTNNIAKVLDESSGLVDSPEFGKQSGESGSTKNNKQTILKVRFLLDGAVLPGSKLDVRAKNIQGLFKVQTIDHSGDTDAQEWYSEAEALPL